MRGFFSGSFIIVVIIAMCLATWTQDELGYVFSLLKGHEIHVPFFLALVINILLNGGAMLFDFCIFALRICGVI